MLILPTLLSLYFPSRYQLLSIWRCSQKFCLQTILFLLYFHSLKKLHSFLSYQFQAQNFKIYLQLTLHLSQTHIFVYMRHLILYIVKAQGITNSSPSPKSFPPDSVHNIITPSSKILSNSLSPTLHQLPRYLYSNYALHSFSSTAYILCQALLISC